MPLTTTRRSENKRQLGDVISDRRKELNITQKKLADLCGVSYYTMISQIELGYITCPRALFKPLAKALYPDDPLRFILNCKHDLFPDEWIDEYTIDGNTLTVDEVLKRLKG